MSIITEWDYHLDVDGVLKGQNADPAIIRKRSPRLVDIAERALDEALQIIKPVAIIETLDVLFLTHDRLELSGGHYIQGSFVPQHLMKARQVAVAACTVSADLSRRVSEIGNKDICYALALDGAGSTAVENLASEVCKYIEEQAAEKGWTTTLPLNPGMEGWPLIDGQSQVFNVLGEVTDIIRLTPTYLMDPFKSLSLIVGMGPDVSSEGVQCDYCTLRGSCQFSKRTRKGD